MAESRPIVAVTRAVPGRVEVPGADVRAAGGRRLSREALLEHVRGASVIVSMYHDRVDGEVMDAAGGQLKGVCNFAVGYENVDVAACEQRGIIATNTPDAVTEGTANLAMALLLAAARRVVEADRFARSDAYRLGEPLGMSDFLGVHLTGQTLLIVGAGRIGLAVAMRARGFGMRVLYVARRRHWEFELAPLAAERTDLEEGLRRADVVSLHTPLTPDTRHLLDARRIGLLKQTAIVVNTARGPVIDEKALAAALKDRRLFAAGLDVYEFEPKVSEELLELPNVVLTPHIGSAEEKYRLEMTRMVSENAAAILAGEAPPNRVA